ncbi:MAG TPA: CDP-archaeol synthase [Candidatus Saccharimonadales bacterium]|nr:CDP-archaeol synthase [Candidatus Saccharimonadales bacterium]
MTKDILLAFWFMVPAFIANGAPLLAARMPLIQKWNTRLDFGKRFHGRPLLGSHKTWRGLVSGMVVATVVLWLQQLFAAHFNWTSLFTGGIDYPALPTLILGPLFGLGALGGDAIESFFKRRRGTRSGGSWVPFDQIDYIIGAVLVSLPFVVLTMRQYVLIFVIWFLMHLAGSYVGWRIGLKEQPV